MSQKENTIRNLRCPREVCYGLEIGLAEVMSKKGRERVAK